MFVLIFYDFCGFISITYTTLNKLLAVFYIIFVVLLKKLEFQLDCFGIDLSIKAAMTRLKV